MPRTTGPSTNPRILSGYAPYAKPRSDCCSKKGSASTTEERLQLLLDDPLARDVQPEQVTCTRCAKTVRLQKGKKYHLAHWLDHRWRCDRAVDPQPRTKCRTLVERKAALEADPDAKVVEPDRIVCRRCNKEVKLRKGRAYGLSCWTQHKLSCQPLSHSSISVSISASPPPPPSEKHVALTSDPLVAALEAQRVKCALCLAWVDIGMQADLDVHAWHRHRSSCVADNFSDNKVSWTRPRFFRPRHRFATTSQSLETHVHSSDNVPQSTQAQTRQPVKSLSSSPAIRVNGALPLSTTRSISPPPLSHSTATSATTSVASTPNLSPRRGPSLFPNSRHLPFPESTPLSMSRFAFDKPERDHGRKVGPGALGLHIHTSQSPPPPAAEADSRPPPYPERTPISLPIPERYWRFESID